MVIYELVMRKQEVLGPLELGLYFPFGPTPSYIRKTPKGLVRT